MRTSPSCWLNPQGRGDLWNAWREVEADLKDVVPFNTAIPVPDLERPNPWDLMTAEEVERLGSTGAHKVQHT